MILERAKYEKPGVTQLMYVGDTPLAPSLGTMVVAGLVLWLLLKKR